MSDVGSAPVPEVSAELAINLSAEGAWLLDVREQHEWDRGHAPDAHHVPMSELRSRLAELPAATRLFVICHSGARSLRVAGALGDAGYDAVNVTGGMEAWQSAGGPVVAGGSAPRV